MFAALNRVQRFEEAIELGDTEIEGDPGDKGPARSKGVMQTFLKMDKIDIAALQAAYDQP